MVQNVPLCVPARPAGTQGTLQPQPAIAARESSAASLAVSAGDFNFSTCLSLLEEYFSTPHTCRLLVVIQLSVVAMAVGKTCSCKACPACGKPL